VNINVIDASLISQMPSSSYIPEGSATDDESDFMWASGAGNVPDSIEPKGMYDIKALSYDAEGNVNLTVWEDLSATDGNMSQSMMPYCDGGPIWIEFWADSYWYIICIGSGNDTGGDDIRAYLKRSMTGFEYWNGSAWSSSLGPSEALWDRCKMNPDGNSLIEMNISSVSDLDISKTHDWSAKISIFYPTHHDYAYDSISIRTRIELVDLFLLLFLMAQEPASAAIPSYPPIIIISTVIITFFVIRNIISKKKTLSVL